MAAALDWLNSGIRRGFPENPDRLARFRDRVSSLDWSKGVDWSTVAELFAAVDLLAEAEVNYYFRRRKTRAALSGIFRTGAWVLGALGILLPLLPASTQDRLSGPSWGYVFLAASGTLLAANALFGGTSGHVRTVSAQLSLEKLITLTRIRWCRYQSEAGQNQPDKEAVEAIFDFILAYAEGIYAATISETAVWGEALLSELNKYADALKQGEAKKGKTGGS